MTHRTKRSLRRALLSFAAAFAVLTLPVFAAIINVPSTATPTIQAGIDAASNGDTVLVAPGTYFENIDFKGKAITVTSSAGPASTIIDGGSKPGVATVVFVTGETTSSVISNFTIRGGGDAIFTGKSDGGIFVADASATIENNTVTANTCRNIDVERGTATMILNNEVSGVLQGNNPQESFCPFTSGVFLGGTPNSSTGGNTVIGNTIENNLTGSGIDLNGAENVLIMNNIIRNNISSEPGSAFTSANSGGTALVQNLIYDNTSTCGGAIGFEDSGYAFLSILIANNTIVDNLTPKLVDTTTLCTPIAQIYPGPYDHGVSGPSALIINNIISGSTSYPAVNCAWYESPSEAIQPTFENDILYNGGGPFFGSYCVDVSGEFNNIVAQAQFVSPSTGDYHLKSTSPAIDKGQNSVVQTFLALTGQYFTTDFDGKPRLQDATGQGCTIDMGAYEYPGTTTDCSSTTETLTSSLNPSSFGQNVTFTAQLSSSNGTPTGDVQFTDGSTILGTQTISGAGSASLSTSLLTIGSHPITAAYMPSGSLPSTTAMLTQVVNGYATATVLTSSLNPANIGQSVTFTATVTSANGTPTGLITFTDGTAILGTATIVNGVATYTTSTLAVGTHPITAAYNPTGTAFNASNAALSQVINGLPTTPSLTVYPTTAVYGTTIQMTSEAFRSGASVTGGSITFMDGNLVLDTFVTTVAAPVATFSTATLAVGIHTITAVYSGDSLSGSSTSAPVTVTITADATTLALTSSPNPALAFQQITLTASLTGSAAANTITFLRNGTVIGTGQTTAQGIATLPISLPTGTYTLTAAFAGTTNLAASTSAPITEVVTQDASLTTLGASPNPGYSPGGTVNLFAAANPVLPAAVGNYALPGGTFTFYDGQTVIGIATAPSLANVPSASISNFTVGTHILTAVYSGDSNYLPSTSAPVTLNILLSDFTLTADPSITIQTEHHKDLNLTLASVGNFTDVIALSCGPMPPDAYCNFPSNGPLLAAGSTLPSTVRIDTDAIYDYLSSTGSSARTPTHPRLRNAIAFALLLPVTLLAATRRRRELRRTIKLFTSLSIFLIATTFTGCSGHYPGHTPPGTYSITITGQGNTTHITHTATVTLIVTE
jgi:hypothetical protein